MSLLIWALSFGFVMEFLFQLYHFSDKIFSTSFRSILVPVDDVSSIVYLITAMISPPIR